jgi:hypothetical protein
LYSTKMLTHNNRSLHEVKLGYKLTLLLAAGQGALGCFR